MLYIVTLTYIFEFAQFLEIVYLISWKRWELEKNFQGKTFKLAILTSIDWKMQPLLLPSVRKSCIYHGMARLQMLLYHDFDIYFQSHELLNVNIWKTVRNSKKCLRVTFIEINVSHRMGPLRLVYFMTLTFIFKVTHFLVMHLLSKMCASSEYPWQICLESHCPAVELLLSIYFLFLFINVITFLTTDMFS